MQSELLRHKVNGSKLTCFGDKTFLLSMRSSRVIRENDVCKS